MYEQFVKQAGWSFLDQIYLLRCLDGKRRHVLSGFFSLSVWVWRSHTTESLLRVIFFVFVFFCFRIFMKYECNWSLGNNDEGSTIILVGFSYNRVDLRLLLTPFNACSSVFKIVKCSEESLNQNHDRSSTTEYTVWQNVWLRLETLGKIFDGWIKMLWITKMFLLKMLEHLHRVDNSHNERIKQHAYLFN